MSGLRRSEIACFLVAVVSCGCGQPETAPAPKQAASPIRQIDTASLPGLGEYSPPLDGGRIEVAGPAGWQLAPRTSDYAARFVAEPGESYPMILVRGEDATAEPITQENVVAFASALASDGTAQPVKIGDRYGALQLKRGRQPNTIDQILERLIFTTVLGDRTYELELRVRQGRVAENQDMLFAVVAGMRPLDTAPPKSTEDVSSTESEQEKATKGAGQKELDELFK